MGFAAFAELESWDEIELGPWISKRNKTEQMKNDVFERDIFSDSFQSPKKFVAEKRELAL